MKTLLIAALVLLTFLSRAQTEPVRLTNNLPHDLIAVQPKQSAPWTIHGTVTIDRTTNRVETAVAPGARGMIYLKNEGRDDKWITTTISEVRTLKFNWLGPREVADSVLISSNSVHYHMTEDVDNPAGVWKPVSN